MNGSKTANFDFNYITASWNPPSYSDRSRALAVRGGSPEKAMMRQDFGKRDSSNQYNPDAVVWWEKSVRSSAMGNWDEMIRAASIAITIDPSYADAYVSRSWAYLEKGYPDESLADSQKALELDVNNVGAHNNRGLYYLRNRQPQMARPDFEAACNGGLRVGCENLKLVAGDNPPGR